MTSRIALSLAEAARVEVASGKRLVTIPLLFTVLGWTLRAGVWGGSGAGSAQGTSRAGSRRQRVGAAILSWLPLIVLADYLLIAVTAQLRLDVLCSL